jgi:ATP-dependent Lhr-like helicase
MGRVELRELLDADVVAGTERQLQHLTAERAARDAEAVADLLRLLGRSPRRRSPRSTAADVGAWLGRSARAPNGC